MTELSLVSDVVSAVEVVAHFTTTSVEVLASFLQAHDVEMLRHESTMHNASIDLRCKLVTDGDCYTTSKRGYS